MTEVEAAIKEMFQAPHIQVNSKLNSFHYTHQIFNLNQMPTICVYA